MNIDELTIGQAREIAALVGGEQSHKKDMWRWWAAESISLSGCALYGIKREESKIVAPVSKVWLEAIEIIPCTDVAIQSIGGAPHVKAE